MPFVVTNFHSRLGLSTLHPGLSGPTMPRVPLSRQYTNLCVFRRPSSSLLMMFQYDYFYPIQQGMPQNCSADVTLVVQHVNEVLANGTSDQKQALRDTFGLGPLTDDVDFTQAIITPLYFWQSLTTTSGYSDFYQWCDFVENAINGTNSTTAPSASGVGLEKALAGWANYIKQMIPNFCSSNYPRYWSDPNTLDCFKYNDPTSGWYTDWSSTNQNLRPWT